jgi:hypothetical protein
VTCDHSLVIVGGVLGCRGGEIGCATGGRAVQVRGGKGSPRKSLNERKIASAFLKWKPFSAFLLGTWFSFVLENILR